MTYFDRVVFFWSRDITRVVGHNLVLQAARHMQQALVVLLHDHPCIRGLAE